MSLPELPDLTNLFNEACAISRGVRDQREADDKAAHLAHVDAVAKAQTALLDSILHVVEFNVREAAQKGHREAVVLAFLGSATFHDLCYLYLLKGPREYNENTPVVSLMPRLRQALKPFRVAHVWKEGTVQNLITVNW